MDMLLYVSIVSNMDAMFRISYSNSIRFLDSVSFLSISLGCCESLWSVSLSCKTSIVWFRSQFQCSVLVSVVECVLGQRCFSSASYIFRFKCVFSFMNVSVLENVILYAQWIGHFVN